LILNLTIPFGYQRSDNCEKCESLKLKLEKGTDDDKNGVLQVEKNFHLSNAQQFYNNLKHVHDMTSPVKLCVVITSGIFQF
jgi:hypothetical protein